MASHPDTDFTSVSGEMSLIDLVSRLEEMHALKSNRYGQNAKVRRTSRRTRSYL